MIISLIAAMDKKHGIGQGNRLPWHLPEDFRHFRQLTLGKPVIMGRKTYESLPEPLAKRRNIVITQQTDFIAPGCEVVHSIAEALNLVKDTEEVMILGGGTIFKTMLPRAQRMYLTLVDADVTADAFFPTWNDQEWQEVANRYFAKDEKNAFAMRFVTLERIKIASPR